MKLFFSFHFGCVLSNEKKKKSPFLFPVLMLGVQPSLHNIVIALHEIETHPVLNSCWENCDSSFTQWNAFYIRVYWDTAYLAQLSALH